MDEPGATASGASGAGNGDAAGEDRDVHQSPNSENVGDGVGPRSPIKSDRFGFLQDDKRFSNEQNPRTHVRSLNLESARSKKWVKMLHDWDRYYNNKPDKLKRRIRKGIPDSVRGAVWSKLINVSRWRGKYPEAMKPELVLGLSQSIRDDIKKDLDRTYPRHELFIEGAGGQACLDRILSLYAVHDTIASYCQGMGFIAGMFLMYMDEETAFYSMLGALENEETPLRLYFLPKFEEVRKSLSIFASLGRMYLPRLWDHLQAENLDESMYAIEWFMTIYTRSFRFDLVTRIWDVLLYEGKKIIYRVALALMKSIEKQLLSARFEQMMSILRELPSVANTEVVIQTMWKIPLKRIDIQRLEDAYSAP